MKILKYGNGPVADTALDWVEINGVVLALSKVSMVGHYNGAVLDIVVDGTATYVNVNNKEERDEFLRAVLEAQGVETE